MRTTRDNFVPAPASPSAARGSAPRTGRVFAEDLAAQIEWVEDLPALFQQCAQVLAAFFGMEVAPYLKRLLVFGPDRHGVLSAALASGLYSNEDLDEIRRNVLAGESYFLPALPAVFLANGVPHMLGEEATHFLRHVCAGTPPSLSRADLFYHVLLHEMLGYMGSKLLDPSRMTPNEEQILASRSSRPWFGFIRRERDAFALAADHLEAEQTPRRARRLRAVYDARPAPFVGAAHLLGYALGERLYLALRCGLFTRADLHALFFEDWTSPGSGLRRYLLLRGELAEVMPEPAVAEL